MLYLTNKDQAIVENNYRNFLESLKNNLTSANIKTSLECYAAITNLLKTGHFSFTGKINYQTSFAYLDLPNMPEGAQTMSGLGCCRHINLLVNDIMQTLSFNSNLLYVKITQEDTWHKVDPSMANHVVITLKDNNNEYLLDAYNDFAFKIVGTNLEPIELTSKADTLMTKYPDENVKKIGLVLKNYYQLREFGIDHLYDYEY